MSSKDENENEKENEKKKETENKILSTIIVINS